MWCPQRNRDCETLSCVACLDERYPQKKRKTRITMVDKKTRDEWRKLFRQAHSCSNCKGVCKPFQLLDTCDKLEEELLRSRKTNELLGSEKDAIVEVGDELAKEGAKIALYADYPDLSDWNSIMIRWQEQRKK